MLSHFGLPLVMLIFPITQAEAFHVRSPRQGAYDTSRGLHYACQVGSAGGSTIKHRGNQFLQSMSLDPKKKELVVPRSSWPRPLTGFDHPTWPADPVHTSAYNPLIT